MISILGDMSARRHILSFEVHGEPFIYKNWEYVELRVKGQSFMIHQIRKMVGLVIAYASGHCGDDHVKRAFEENMEDIPKVKFKVLRVVPMNFFLNFI